MHDSSSFVAIQEIVEEIDEDGSGELEFPEFVQLAAKFLIEEDEEEMKWELREAFRIYDKQGTTNALKFLRRCRISSIEIGGGGVKLGILPILGFDSVR